MANEISAQYSKALELHKKIIVSAQMAQASLWDMCAGLKEMRDGKLYKELGYQNFEEYCETEHGFSRSNAHKYISIIENIDPENVSTWKHLGKGKLYLLSTLSEADQQKITAENDVDAMTVRELEAEVRKLKDVNDRLNTINEHLEEDLDDRDHEIRKIRGTLKDIDDQNIELRNEIKELRSRPIDVAVMEPSEDVRQLKETIKNLERSTEEQMEKMEAEHVADIRDLHEKNRAETQKKLAEQKAQYEEKLRQAAASTALATSASSEYDDKQAFKAYYTAAYDSFSRMIEFAKKSENKDFFQAKIKSLISAFTHTTDNM